MRHTETFNRDELLHRLAGRLQNLHREGSYLRSACPKCGGDDRFYTGPGVEYAHWHCHACDHKTPTAVLLGVTFRVTPQPSVREWSAEPALAGLGAIRALYKSLAGFAAECLGSRALTYLAGRGVDAETAKRAGLGYIDRALYGQWWGSLSNAEREAAAAAGLPEAKARMQGFAAMFACGGRGKIIFPYRDATGAVVDIRTRSISPKDTIRGRAVRYTGPKGSYGDRGALSPYGLDGLGGPGRVVLTEGELKRLVPLAAGVETPILALRGVEDPALDVLDPFRGRLVILAFDNDTKRGTNGLTAGESATVKTGRKLRAHGIDVVALNPALLGDQKGIDDFVNTYGPGALSDLLTPEATVTLPEFEAQLSQSGADLSGFTTPRADPGVARMWTPGAAVDDFAHPETETVTLDDAVDQIAERTASHWRDWNPGNPQLLITADAGVGKTHTTIQTAREWADAHGLTMAVFLPSHDTIDEKIADGTLPGFQHIYGRRWDDLYTPDGEPTPNPIRNCQQADVCNSLARYGYSPRELVCPKCPALYGCDYLAQFDGPENRAYTHGHLHTGVEVGDLAIVDELTHKTFIDELEVHPGDLINVLSKPGIKDAQRALLKAILDVFALPGLDSLGGAELYEVLGRVFPGLMDVDGWGDGSSVQLALNSIALEFAERDGHHIEAEQLPAQFADKLFAAMSDDVRRLQSGRLPSGRLRLVCLKNSRKLVLTHSKGPLGSWFYGAPVAVLNATADADTLDSLIGPIDVLSPCVAILEENQIIQDVTLNHAKSSLTGRGEDADRRRAAWLGRIRSHITDEADTVIITTKSLEPVVQTAFPEARTAYFHALEGRNDLQSNTLIIANAPPVNVDAVKREAAALFGGDVDTMLTRRITAFGEQNAAGEWLAVEQLDFVDERVRGLLWQHRDAATVQAAHRARMVRATGRRVVVLTARPIPGLRPTQTITERASKGKGAERTTDAINRLVEAGRTLAETVGVFTADSLAEAAGVSVTTARARWSDAVSQTDVGTIDLPVIQTIGGGGEKRRTLRIALTAMEARKLYDLAFDQTLHVDHDRYKESTISTVIHVQCLLSRNSRIDWKALSLAFPEPEEGAAAAIPDTQERQGDVRNPEPEPAMTDEEISDVVDEVAAASGLSRFSAFVEAVQAGALAERVTPGAVLAAREERGERWQH